MNENDHVRINTCVVMDAHALGDFTVEYISASSTGCCLLTPTKKTDVVQKICLQLTRDFDSSYKAAEKRRRWQKRGSHSALWMRRG